MVPYCTLLKYFPLDLDVNNSGNVCSMIFSFMDASIYYNLIIQRLPKTL